MRIISQDKNHDIPYDTCFISVVGKNVQATSIFDTYNEASIALARYSNKEKAFAVLQSIRMQRESLHNGSMTQDLFFHMPQDNDVE